MVFFSIYLSNLSKRLGGSEDAAETVAVLGAGRRPDCLRLATVNGRRIGRVEPIEYIPAPRRRKALRLVAVNGARLA